MKTSSLYSSSQGDKSVVARQYESFATHTCAYPMLQDPLDLFLENCKRMMSAEKPDYGIDLIERTIGLLQDFLREDNAYTQKLTKPQRTLADDCIMQFRQLYKCRREFEFVHCSYDDIDKWNSEMRERAIKKTKPLSAARFCLNVSKLGSKGRDARKAIETVVVDSEIGELRKSLATIRCGDGFLNTFRDFVIDFDSFLAKNAAPLPAPKEKPKLDKSTLELIQEILGFLHSHIADDSAKAEEEQISIFLEEHNARVIWPKEEDVHSSDHFFVSYDSTLTESKDIRPCVICGNLTLRGSRILPSAN